MCVEGSYLGAGNRAGVRPASVLERRRERPLEPGVPTRGVLCEAGRDREVEDAGAGFCGICRLSSFQTPGFRASGYGSRLWPVSPVLEQRALLVEEALHGLGHESGHGEAASTSEHE